jgi:ribonuclease HI
MDQLNSITIIADASYCPNTKAAGYGVWIAGCYGKSPFEGQLKSPACNNTAEIMAIANALWHAMHNHLVYANSFVLIQTDSETAIRMFEGKIEPKNQQQVDAKYYVRDIIRRFDLKVTYRHCAGHTNGPSKRSRAQQHCDDRAKRQMLKARASLNLAEVANDLGIKVMQHRTGYLRINSRNKRTSNG